ncbi:hypothetical protein B0H13DRAFT_1887157 [Mycena leptocephala]|nr:hypothetical protein B0H13DRAFT_1887157 [Mycena leptocephala]
MGFINLSLSVRYQLGGSIGVYRGQGKLGHKSDSFGEDDASGLEGLLGSDRIEADDDTEKSDAGSTNGAGQTSEDEDEDNNSEDEPKDSEASKTPKKPAGHRRTGSAARVTQSTFSPVSARLANAGRFAVRVGIATEDGFPRDHTEFAWKAISGVVDSSNATELHQRIALAEESDKRKAQLANYAWGGAAQLRGEVKALCKAAVALFGIPGEYSPEEIIKHIDWLIGKKSIFRYGGINLKDHKYDCQQPYGAAFYKDVTTKQWFDSLKSEGVRTQSFEQFVDSPVPVITLVTGAMENSLKEHASGIRVQIKFTEEEFAPRSPPRLAAQSSIKVSDVNTVRSSSNFPHLKRVIAAPEEDEFEGVDFEALEASAIGDGKSDAPVAEEPAAAGVGAPLAVAA